MWLRRKSDKKSLLPPPPLSPQHFFTLFDPFYFVNRYLPPLTAPRRVRAQLGKRQRQRQRGNGVQRRLHARRDAQPRALAGAQAPVDLAAELLVVVGYPI